jgi:hypothetical protein
MFGLVELWLNNMCLFCDLFTNTSFKFGVFRNRFISPFNLSLYFVLTPLHISPPKNLPLILFISRPLSRNEFFFSLSRIYETVTANFTQCNGIIIMGTTSAYLTWKRYMHSFYLSKTLSLQLTHNENLQL